MAGTHAALQLNDEEHEHHHQHDHHNHSHNHNHDHGHGDCDCGDEHVDALPAQNGTQNLVADIFISTAAVADYRTEEAAPQKIKKTQDVMTLNLVKNPDILATISHAHPELFVVGFAAETQNIEHYAQGKLVAKDLDMIACNDVSRTDIGFASDDNAMQVFFAQRYEQDVAVLEKASKDDIAAQLVTIIGDTLTKK